MNTSKSNASLIVIREEEIPNTIPKDPFDDLFMRQKHRKNYFISISKINSILPLLNKK